MCDYSLNHVASRAAAIGDKLVTTNFLSGTRGFVALDCPGVAVCVMPGTELAFASAIESYASGTLGIWEYLWSRVIVTAKHATAIFRQVDKDNLHTHHDALELPDGSMLMLTHLKEGQSATVLQLPAAPKTQAEVQEQKRLEVVA